MQEVKTLSMSKRNRALVWVAIFGFGLMPSLGLSAISECTSEQKWNSLKVEDERKIIYSEDGPGSPSSPARFEFWKNDQLLWYAKATRSCTQGVSRCFLLLPYEVDGKGGYQIKSQMNYIETPSGERLIVFSHLSEQIIYQYLKAMPTQDIKLVGESYFEHTYPRKAEMVIPNVFYGTLCSKR